MILLSLVFSVIFTPSGPVQCRPESVGVEVYIPDGSTKVFGEVVINGGKHRVYAMCAPDGRWREIADVQQKLSIAVDKITAK